MCVVNLSLTLDDKGHISDLHKYLVHMDVIGCSPILVTSAMYMSDSRPQISASRDSDKRAKLS